MGCLALLVTVAYTLTFDNGFVHFDDDGYVVENRIVQQGLTAESIRYAWTTFDLGNWIPLTWLSYELNIEFFGLSPAALHTTDLLLHVANVLLLYLFLRRSTGAVGRSGVVALLWGVHPLHVESVAWVAERKDVLSTLFLMLALLSYERYAAQRAWNSYLTCCALFVASLLAKPMMVTLPVLFLLIDVWPLGRWERISAAGPHARYPTCSTRQLIREKLPLLAISFVFSVIALLAQGSQAAMVGANAQPLIFRLANAVAATAWYVWQTVWPHDLSPFYPLWFGTIDGPRIALSLGVLSAISLGVWRARRGRGWLVSGWLWFLISLLPVIGLVQVGSQAHADRYSYVPQIGLMVLLVWQVEEWLRRFDRGLVLRAVVTAAVTLVWTAQTFWQVGYWHDPLALWQRAVALDGRNWLAHFHLGRHAVRMNDAAQATKHFQRTAELSPRYADTYIYLAALADIRGDRSTARTYFEQAIQADPNHYGGLFQLGVIARKEGQFDAALGYLSRCVALNPQVAGVHDEVGLVHLEANDPAKALEAFTRAIALEPDNSLYQQHVATARSRLSP